MATRTRPSARFTAPILTLATASLLTFVAAPAHAAEPTPPTVSGVPCCLSPATSHPATRPTHSKAPFQSKTPLISI